MVFLQDYERMNVADALIPKTYASGEVIVRQGDAADGMFFLEGGICEVYVESGVGNRKKVIFFFKKNFFNQIEVYLGAAFDDNISWDSNP